MTAYTEHVSHVDTEVKISGVKLKKLFVMAMVRWGWGGATVSGHPTVVLGVLQSVEGEGVELGGVGSV